MVSQKNFYNLFHHKNKKFNKVIKRPNFTYYYHLEILHHWFKNFTNLRVLDVGCGVAPISLYLANQQAKVTAIDISTRAIKLAQQAAKDLGLKLTLKAEQLHTGQQQNDLVICSEVLEHIAHESNFLKKLNSQLKKTGLLYLSVPSDQNCLFKLGLLNKFDQQVGHLRRYNTENIQKLLTKHGFRILTLKKAESPLRNLLFISPLGFLIKFIRGPLIKIFHWLDECLIPLLGYCNIIVIARKKTSCNP